MMQRPRPRIRTEKRKTQTQAVQMVEMTMRCWKTFGKEVFSDQLQNSKALREAVLVEENQEL